MYDEDLEIDKWNCADYYYIADYFQDDVQLPKIIEFIKKNITFSNSLELTNYSDKFENAIEQFQFL